MTNDIVLAKAKHLIHYRKSTSSRMGFIHDMVGYNYRMPNINAVLLVAQLENLDSFINSKRMLADKYETFLKSSGYIF